MSGFPSGTSFKAHALTVAPSPYASIRLRSSQFRMIQTFFQERRWRKEPKKTLRNWNFEVRIKLRELYIAFSSQIP